VSSPIVGLGFTPLTPELGLQRGLARTVAAKDAVGPSAAGIDDRLTSPGPSPEAAPCASRALLPVCLSSKITLCVCRSGGMAMSPMHVGYGIRVCVLHSIVGIPAPAVGPWVGSVSETRAKETCEVCVCPDWMQISRKTAHNSTNNFLIVLGTCELNRIKFSGSTPEHNSWHACTAKLACLYAESQHSGRSDKKVVSNSLLLNAIQ